ncbi:hypothetical protein H0O00_01740 [Candidatus Micrarchaeota archaeon]|nr:hypothetical protein [Candidatus Micrarchaeota archaeon]
MKQGESVEVRIQRAQYYMSAANTLVLTGTIFILGFVTSLTMASPDYDILRLIMLGLLPLGLIALYDGITHYFRAEKMMRSARIVPAQQPVRHGSGIDIVTVVLLIGAFLAVNWLMYDTWMLNPVTVLALCVATVFIGWIKLSVEK